VLESSLDVSTRACLFRADGQINERNISSWDL
jgi:hypothetical protein